MEVGPSGGAAHAAQTQQTQQAASQQSTQLAKETEKAAVALETDKASAPKPVGNAGHNINITA